MIIMMMIKMRKMIMVLMKMVLLLMMMVGTKSSPPGPVHRTMGVGLPATSHLGASRHFSSSSICVLYFCCILSIFLGSRSFLEDLSERSWPSVTTTLGSQPPILGGAANIHNRELHKNGEVWRRGSWVWRRNIQNIAKGTTDPRVETVTTKTT